MQAGLVSTRLALSDIFTWRRVTLRVLVALVETGAGECPTLSWPPRTTNGCLINSERRKHRRRLVFIELRPGSGVTRTGLEQVELINLITAAGFTLQRTEPWLGLGEHYVGVFEKPMPV